MSIDAQRRNQVSVMKSDAGLFILVLKIPEVTGGST